MKALGTILIIAGTFVVLGTVGQSDMETFAATHGKIVETVPFKTQVLSILAGIVSAGVGLTILKEE